MAILLEPFAVPEIYCDGIDHIENLGTNCRLVFFTLAQGGGQLERIAAVKLIRPMASLVSKRELLSLISPPLADPLALIEAMKRGH